MKKIKITSGAARKVFFTAAFLSALCVIFTLAFFEFEMTSALSLAYKDAVGCSVLSFTLYLGVLFTDKKI